MIEYDDSRLILISNDDGYSARGIAHLTQIARRYGRVVTVAPEAPQSGKSSAITIETPIRARIIDEQPGLTRAAVNGTPVDCVKWAMNCLLKETPALILAGINHGLNSGICALYSGTMGVVFEGSIYGVPSIGFSYGDYTDQAEFHTCDHVITTVIEDVLTHGLPEGTCLNVNIPKSDTMVTKLALTHATRGRWKNEYDRRTHPIPGVGDYFWLTGTLDSDDPDKEHSDIDLVRQGIATITPCRADQTDHAAIATLHSRFGS